MTGNNRRGNENEPIALESCFGWVVYGYYEAHFQPQRILLQIYV